MGLSREALFVHARCCEDGGSKPGTSSAEGSAVCTRAPRLLVWKLAEDVRFNFEVHIPPAREPGAHPQGGAEQGQQAPSTVGHTGGSRHACVGAPLGAGTTAPSVQHVRGSDLVTSMAGPYVPRPHWGLRCRGFSSHCGSELNAEVKPGSCRERGGNPGESMRVLGQRPRLAARGAAGRGLGRGG